MKQPRISITTFVLLLIGGAISIYLVSHHYALLYGMREGKSFCSVSAKVDCDAVNASSYSEVAGVPVAMLSLFVFVVEFLLLLGIQAFGEDEKAKLSRFLFYLCSTYFVATLVMGGISSMILKTYCLLCMSLWALGLLLMILSACLVSGPKFKSLGSDLKSLFKGAAQNGARGVLVLFLVIPAGSLLASSMWKQNISADIDKLVLNSLSEWVIGRKFDFVTAGSPAIGNPKGSMQIVEFSDYLCPHCKRAAPSLHAFVNAHRDDVYMVFQAYPLDNTCNHSLKSQVHDGACLYAKAALCADKQNKFLEAHEWIFDHQEELSAASIDALADALHLDKGALHACIDGSEAATELAAQIDRAERAGVQGTPSIFVNGQLLMGGFVIPILEGAYKTIKSSKGP